MALGGVLFLALLLRPIVAHLGVAGQGIERTCIAIAAWSALALVLCEAATVALQSAVLVGTVDLSIADTLRADFAIAGLVKTTAAALIALTLFALGQRAPITPLLVLAAIELAAATLDHACRRAAGSPHAAAAGGVPAPVRRGDLDRRHSVLPGRAWPRPERSVLAHDRRALLAHVDGRRRLHRGERPYHEPGLHRRLGRLLRHRLWRDGRRQDRDVPDAARSRRRQLPAGRAAARATRHAGHPTEALRRGGDRHRCGDLLRRRLADLRAAGDRPDAGSRHLVGDRRAQHAEVAAADLARSRRAGAAGVAGEAGCRGGATQRGSRRSPSCRAPAICRRAMPPTSPGRNTTTTGRDCSCWRSACCRC